VKLRRTRPARRGRIEIIPMIDVMFFLLATFMLTSLTMQRLDAVKLELPQGEAQPLSTQQALTMSISQDGQIRIDRQTVSLRDIAPTVRRMLHADGDIVVAADAGASHGLVTQAMLQARQGGVSHFLIAVQRGS
jgi:biopolymer transport protein ExbD